MYEYSPDPLFWLDPFGLSKWKRILGDLSGSKTVRQELLDRGGAGSALKQIATYLHDEILENVAKLAAQGDQEAKTAIKLVDQAKKKAQKYSGCKK